MNINLISDKFCGVKETAYSWFSSTLLSLRNLTPYEGISSDSTLFNGG